MNSLELTTLVDLTYCHFFEFTNRNLSFRYLNSLGELASYFKLKFPIIGKDRKFT